MGVFICGWLSESMFCDGCGWVGGVLKGGWFYTCGYVLCVCAVCVHVVHACGGVEFILELHLLCFLQFLLDLCANPACTLFAIPPTLPCATPQR